jgi:prepilin-type N-terminal cleavage/methylation domain-containing protein
VRGTKYNFSAFSLIEILVVLFIIGLLGSIVIPNFQTATPRAEREQFITKLSSLTQFGCQQALITQKIHRLYFNLKTRTIALQIEREIDNKKKFTSPESNLVESEFEYPEQFEIKQFIIEGFDELKRFAGSGTDTTWFYLVPNGMTQDAKIIFTDKKDTLGGRPRTTTLHINPFNGHFRVLS